MTEQQQQHPLTDEILDNISPLPPLKNLCEGERCFATRAARWGADWQLKQVIEWLNETIFERSMCQDGIDSLPEELEKAMRPQQQEEN